ncbi:DUF3006 domain-containing protein [Halopenitus persicus]|uniref:DUF3006 domain-containing protein n=1 Tax=Halopenitus persicus TaxID=1048396 RepID=UPI000AF77B25|nr:DUF3006 domain-containing protein [Halopenitus persicus]
MTEDGTYTAVIDRFEDDLAVLLLEDDGNVTDQILVSKSRLPEAGTHVDAVLSVRIADGTAIDVAYRPEETSDRSRRMQHRFDELSERPPSDESETN